ncbi:MAG TPA: potassium-transporting ATPase subunit KdpC [Polyangiaceae bacterium]|nr:potassium-transporting ATPase subunit KdpC [Polyangiaceae bacterium]
MKTLRPALMLTAFFVLVTGLAFPFTIWAIASVAFPSEAHGSLVRSREGRVVGSALIGQAFTRPEYFQPRPSAAGNGYDAANSGGTNLGPSSDKLINGVKDDPATKDADETYAGFVALAKAYRERNGLAPNAPIPADAATRSASGLDPDISPANALLQSGRVARARNLSEERVRRLVGEHTRSRVLGVFGEPRVNVLELNMALDALK